MARFAWLCGLGLATLAVPALGVGPDPVPAVVPAAPLAAPPLAAVPPPAAAPATGPAAASADVFVTPFRPLADAGPLAWAGVAVQQNLVGDLSRATLRPAAGDGGADPLAAARAAGARFLVTGTFQSAPPAVRFDGQVVDAATGSVLAGLAATGDGRDLFALEDALSAQAVRAVRRAASPASAGNADRPVPPALQPAAVAAAVQPPAGGTGSSYDGSALQAYVDANRTPSTDYDQQLTNSRDRNTLGSYTNSGTGGFGYGGFGYGGFGYGGFAGEGNGFGGYALGVSYPVTGTFGYAGLGGRGFGGGFGGRGFGGSGFGGGRR